MLKLLRSKIVKDSLKQTLSGFKTNIPIFLAILLLIAIVQQYVPLSLIGEIENTFVSAIVANLIWSIAAWNPVNSYIIASEFWPVTKQWLVIAIFLVARITVGIVQIPAESFYFWKKYAVIRNLLAFIFSFVAWYIIYYLYLTL